MHQAREVSAAILRSITEEQLGAADRGRGRRVVVHRGRYWMEAPRGFYQPIHWLARLDTVEATTPRRIRWGFRAALTAADAHHGNGSLPIHLLTDVAGYTLDNLSQRRRRNVRTSHRRAEMVELTGSALLREQGYEVRRSAEQRTGYGHAGSRSQYVAELEHYFAPEGRLVLAGLVDGRLGGFLTGTAVARTAYIDNVWIATDALRSAIGTGLVFEFVQACRRGGTVDEIAYGLDTPEDPELSAYKADLGFPPRRVTAMVRVNPLVAAVLSRRRPYAFYRLTGRRERRSPLAT